MEELLQKRMLELIMLELLTYEPFGKFLPDAEMYISKILSKNYQQLNPMLHDLFVGFSLIVSRIWIPWA